ncbi:hypothetical protein As57867_019111, partial [Aphanomyces stellatus]
MQNRGSRLDNFDRTLDTHISFCLDHQHIDQMKSPTFLASAVALTAFVQLADAHGRLLFPPHRGYIGKLDAFKGLIPINYSDNGLSAGGIAQTSGGKHGVCGDPYNGVREHETGGTY